MVLGTAGFTAALSLWRMEANGQTPDMGPVVVTGASGGVGSIAIDLLSRAGYEAHAISGKVEHFDFLRQLGATQCISRHDLHWSERPMDSATWAGAIDNVGGDMLAGLTRVIKPWGSIASCGMAGGIGVRTTVMPFIIRGISLLGINSSGCPYPIRERIWDRWPGPGNPPTSMPSKRLSRGSRRAVAQVRECAGRRIAGSNPGARRTLIGAARRWCPGAFCSIVFFFRNRTKDE
jgi:acrylyl-CoA reductase (NADPH)